MGIFNILVCALFTSPLAIAQAETDAQWDQGYEIEALPAILPQRERTDAVNRMLTDRLDNLLPQLMREADLDMWLVINREYAEDPVYLTLVPEPVFAARRTTILVFSDPGSEEGVERLTVSRYALGDYYGSAWEDGGSDDEQWTRLAEVIAERAPKRIGINRSEHWAFGDGLSAGLHDRLKRALPAEYQERLVSAEELCIRWLETRTEMEMAVYPQLVQLARGVIAEAFSNCVITPGVTTTDDVAWYLRQRFSDLGLPIWFQPYCNVQREGLVPEPGTAIWGTSHVVIERGDLVHTDVGIQYLRLCTDTQEMAYVLKLGESEVPAGIRAAMQAGNRWQDTLTAAFVTGRTGNQILASARETAIAEGLRPTIYTHPLGFYGHSAGPTVGMWDNQGPTPVRGDWALRPNTCYAIEGSITVTIPEWGDQEAQIKLEQDGYFDGERVIYIGGRQIRWHVVR